MSSPEHSSFIIRLSGKFPVKGSEKDKEILVPNVFSGELRNLCLSMVLKGN